VAKSALDLSHVLWLGGGARTGKTTVSRLIAGKYDLKLYNIDWHLVREHRTRLDPVKHPTALSSESASPDDRLVRQSVEQIVERGILSWTETFDLVVEDVRVLPSSRTVLVEGPGAFPWCVAPLLISPRHALFLIPTPEFRDAVFARRGADPGQGTSDPEVARANLRARDLAIAARIIRSCRELGLRYVEVDSSMGIEDTLALAEDQFGELLPQELNV
jgi:hypothetical protein